MTTTPPTSALRLFAYLTAAAFVLTVLADVVTYVTQAPIAGVAVVVLLGAPLAFTVRVWGTVTAVMAGLLALLGGPALAEYSWIVNGDEAIDAPELLAQRPGVTRIGLHDARIDLAATRTHVHTHRSGKTTTYPEHVVAPIVPGTWQPGDPVHLYAACPAAEGDCRDRWATPTNTFVRAPPYEQDCYQATLDAPLGTPGTPATPGLPVTPVTPVTFVYFVDPEVHLAALRHGWFAMMSIPVLGWLLIGGLVAATNTLTMRRLAAVAAVAAED